MVARVKQLFTKNRVDPDDKVLATLLYHLRLSYRRVSTAMEDAFSYESVRTWYRKVGSNLPAPKRIHRQLIGVDETKLKISGLLIFVWSCVDVKRNEMLALKVFAGRGELDAIVFIREALGYCTNRPIVLVDHGPWYPPALEYLGLRYKQVTFGKRNIVESWFSTQAKDKEVLQRLPIQFNLSICNKLSQLICKDAKHAYVPDNLTTLESLIVKYKPSLSTFGP